MKEPRIAGIPIFNQMPDEKLLVASEPNWRKNWAERRAAVFFGS